MSERTYTKQDVKAMREQVAKIRSSGNDQKLLGKFMSQWNMPHNVTLEKFVEQCAEIVGGEVEAESPATQDEKKKPDKDGSK